MEGIARNSNRQERLQPQPQVASTEHRVLGNALPPSYLALRRQVALATCMLLALTMFVSDTAGLS